MDPIFVQFVHDHADVFAVEYHTWWPGPADPFYQYNIPENTDRTNYYNVNATPWEWVDGVIEPVWVYTYERIEAAYNARKAVPTTVTLSRTGYFDEGTGSVDITVTASTDAALPAGDYRLHIVLTESELFWAAPNGMDWHDFIMRDMYPDAGGTPVTFAGGFPQVVEATAAFDASDLATENCDIVYFLQNFDTREVFQAGSVALADLADQTGVAEVPAGLRLGRSFPNPFNPRTVIPVSMEKDAAASLVIVDAQGRKVRTLHEGAISAGQHQYSWDGTDDGGTSVASGVYLAILHTAELRESQRLVLLK